MVAMDEWAQWHEKERETATRPMCATPAVSIGLPCARGCGLLVRARNEGDLLGAIRPRWRNESGSRIQTRQKTPTLVIHGMLDYRVPAAQGLIYYSTLKPRRAHAAGVVF